MKEDAATVRERTIQLPGLAMHVREAGAGPSDDGHVMLGGLGAAIPVNPRSPYAVTNGRLLLDGADIAFLHLILDCPAEDVHMGMRVKAVWKPRDEWGTTIENISHFAPTGEPDADFETYRNQL